MNEVPTMRPIEILMVEDNPGDVRLIQEALKEAKVSNTLHVMEDGATALDFLYRRGAYGAAPRPDLILLDLNLPRKNGGEVLEEIKQDTHLKTIPVIILTTSQAEEDVLRACRLHANFYIIKSVDFIQFVSRIARAIEELWLTIVTLPPK